jgi:Ankyrin repeats (many copies)
MIGIPSEQLRSMCPIFLLPDIYRLNGRVASLNPRTASSHSGSFIYPTEPQRDSAPQNADDDEEEEEAFVYPNVGDNDAASDAPPVQTSDIVTSIAFPSDSQLTVPIESSVLTLSPSTTLREASPPRSPQDSSPAPLPQTHATPAQLEALYAAASSGDLPLLQRIIRNASQTGNIEPFSLVNDASSRTGLTGLHAAASRGYLNIVKWRKNARFPSHSIPDETYVVVEDCGAIPDLEDKEGEV